MSVSVPKELESYLKVDREEDKNIHEANGKYLGSYTTKTIDR